MDTEFRTESNPRIEKICMKEIQDEWILHYWAEIMQIVQSLDMILTPQEIEIKVAKIRKRCCQKLSKKMVKDWGTRRISKMQKNILAVEKESLLERLLSLDGKDWIHREVKMLSIRIQPKLREFFGRLEYLMTIFRKMLPILPSCLCNFMDDYRNVFLPHEFKLLDKQSRGELTRKLNDIFNEVEEQNRWQLRDLEPKFMEVLENHYDIVSNWRLNGTTESSPFEYGKRVHKELRDLMNILCYNQNHEKSSLGDEAKSVPSLFHIWSKDEKCFDTLDKYYERRLSRNFNAFNSFLLNIYSQVVKGNERKQDVEQQATFHAFLSHDWGINGKNHDKVKRIGEALRKRGLDIWIDDEQIVSELDQRITDGIDQSGSFLVFLTDNYVKKVSQGAFDDYCKREFRYAFNQLSDCRMVPIIMDSSLRDFKNWKGLIGLNLPPCLYHDFSVFSNLEDMKGESFDTAIDALANKISSVTSQSPDNFIQKKETVMKNAKYYPFSFIVGIIAVVVVFLFSFLSILFSNRLK